jgi:hypothetical protein
MGSRWYERPEGEALALRTNPRLASWNRATDPDQVALRKYLTETADLVAPAVPTIPWSFWLDVGLPVNHVLTNGADLDNYALPLASRVKDSQLVSVWCSKRHAETSQVIVGPARAAAAPADAFQIQTTASAQTTAYKQQVQAGVADAAQLPDGPLRLQISFLVGPSRNWMNLWKPTIDALDPLLGRTAPGRDWHPRDDRIVELGLHVVVDSSRRHDLEVWIAAQTAE